MNILIIEDEEKVVAFLKKGLEEQGYNVDIAFDGQFAPVKGGHFGRFFHFGR